MIGSVCAPFCFSAAVVKADAARRRRDIHAVMKGNPLPM
jgi:hypothetical protein